MAGIIRIIFDVFSSLRTAVILFLLLCIFYLMGTIFPQGATIDEYRDAGGALLFIVERLPVLNIFESAPFIFLVILFFLNITICSINKLFYFKNYLNIIRFTYHLLFGALIILIFVSHYLRVEETVSLRSEDEQQIFFSGKNISLRLNSFKIKYIESPDFNYGKGVKKRLNLIFMEGSKQGLMSLGREPAYYDFIADLSVKLTDSYYTHSIRVNSPLVKGNYSFNLFGFQDTIAIKIENETMKVKSGDWFQLPGTQCKLGEVETGNLVRYDRTEEFLEPSVLIHCQDTAQGEGGIKLVLNSPVTLNGKRIEFSGYEREVTFGIRYDPVIKFIKILSFFTMFLMIFVLYNKKSVNGG